MEDVPCIRRLRIPVATIVGMIADGMKVPAILKAYPDLVEADIFEALQYAVRFLVDNALSPKVAAGVYAAAGTPRACGTTVSKMPRLSRSVDEMAAEKDTQGN